MPVAAPAFQEKIEQLTAAFAAELVAIVQAAILESVTQAVGGAAPAPTRSGVAAGPRSRPGRRQQDQIRLTTERLLEAITTTPGLRIEQLAQGLGAPTRDLSLPARRLLADGLVKSKGTRRATTYWPTKGSKRR
jgi:hypothetical protein